MIGDTVFQKSTRAYARVIDYAAGSAALIVLEGEDTATPAKIVDLIILRERPDLRRRRTDKHASQRDLYLALDYLTTRAKRPSTVADIQDELVARGFEASNYYTTYSALRRLEQDGWIYRDRATNRTEETYYWFTIREHL